MADNDILGIKPWDTERFVKSQSSDHSNESSTYCVFCNPPISISHGSNLSSSSEGYVSFTNIAHAVQIHIPRAHISHHNRVLPGDNVGYGIGRRHTITLNKCFCRWTTNDPAVQMHIPRPYIFYPNTGDSDKIDPTSVPDERDYPIRPVPHVEETKKPDTNINWRRIKQVVLVVLMCLFVSAVVAFIVINKNVDDPVPTPFPPDPQLHQSITSDDHVHCELTGTCLPSSLAIYVNVNNSAVLVPDSRACSYNDKKTGTMVSIEATIPSSMFTKNQSISCVPLMRNQELAENLTNTIHFVPKCPGPECKPNCKDVSTNTSTYYPNSVYCDKFYQCDNGEAKEHTCGKGAYWEPTKCTCANYNTTICNMNNNTRITPLRTLNPCFGKIDNIT